MPSIILTLAGLTVGLMAFSSSPADTAAQDSTASATPPGTDNPSPAERRPAAIGGLQPIAVLVGEWRGVGQPRRGSRVGAWIETAACQWRFGEQPTALVLTSENGRQFQHIEFRWNAERSVAEAVVRTDDDEPRVFMHDAAASEDGRLVFADAAASPDSLNRLTLRTISDIRVTLLFETRRTPMASWRRVVEVGYTRAGERLASAGTGERQCIVTGGRGTMAVMHEGKTYFVCCEGCRQAFEADPAGTIAEYRERLKSDDSSP